MQGAAEFPGLLGVFLRIKEPVGEGNDADAADAGKIDAGAGKAGVPAAVGIADAGLEAQASARRAGLLPLCLDQQGIGGGHVILAKPFVGGGGGKYAGMAGNAAKVIKAVSVIGLARHGLAVRPKALEGDAPIAAHLRFNGVSIGGGHNMAGGIGMIGHFFKAERGRQILREAGIQGLSVSALNHLAQQHEIQIGINHALRGLGMLKGIGEDAVKILPLPGIEGIPGGQGGGVGQKLKQADVLHPVPQIGIAFYFWQQGAQGGLQRHPSLPDQMQYLGGRGDFGQAGHVEQGILAGVAHTGGRQRFIGIKYPHAGGGKIALRLVTLQYIVYFALDPGLCFCFHRLTFPAFPA